MTSIDRNGIRILSPPLLRAVEPNSTGALGLIRFGGHLSSVPSAPLTPSSWSSLPLRQEDNTLRSYRKHTQTAALE